MVITNELSANYYNSAAASSLFVPTYYNISSIDDKSYLISQLKTLTADIKEIINNLEKHDWQYEGEVLKLMDELNKLSLR